MSKQKCTCSVSQVYCQCGHGRPDPTDKVTQADQVKRKRSCKCILEKQIFDLKARIKEIEAEVEKLNTHPINIEPLKHIYRDIDDMITEFQTGDADYSADLLACDIQKIFQRLYPYVPQLSIFPNDMKDIDIMKQQLQKISQLEGEIEQLEESESSLSERH